MREFAVHFCKTLITSYLVYKFFECQLGELALVRLLRIYFVRVVVLDRYFVVNKIFYICLTRYKPIELMHYTVPSNLLCGKQGETIGKVKSHLPAENTGKWNAGIVIFLLYCIIKNVSV